MTTHKCQLKQNTNYDIKQRYIPTFAHQPIFQQSPLRPKSSRCTPTFHSTVFDTEGYNIKTVHQKKQKPLQITAHQNQNKLQKSHQQNVKQKIMTLGQSHVFHLSRDNWFDHTKQQILGSIQNCQNHRYSRERKYIDMSSDPVFTDYNYEKNSNLNTKTQPQRLKLTTNVASQSFRNLQKPTLIDQNVQTVNEDNPQIIQDNNQKAIRKEQQLNQKVPKNSKETKKSVNFTKTAKQQKSQKLTLKGTKINQQHVTAKKQKLLQQKPIFTVVRKSRVHH